MKTYAELSQCFSLVDDGIPQTKDNLAIKSSTQQAKGAVSTCPYLASFDLHSKPYRPMKFSPKFPSKP